MSSVIIVKDGCSLLDVYVYYIMAINQLKAGATLSLISFGVVNLIGLFYTPFMLRMMGQEEYGLFSLVASLISYLTILDFGFGNAIIRYTAKYRAENRERDLPNLFGMFCALYGVIGLLAMIIGFILFFNIDVLFGRTMNEVEQYKIRIMMLLLIFNLVFTFGMSVWRNIPLAYERFIFSKLVNLIRMLLNPIVMVVLLCMGYKAIAMVVVTTVFNVVTLGCDYAYCKFKLNTEIRFSKMPRKLIKEIAIYSFWIFLGVIVERIFWSTGQFILGMYIGSAAVAVYAISVQLAYVYMGFGSSLWSVFLPRVTAITTRVNSESDVSNLFVRMCRIQYLQLLLVFLAFFLFGQDFIRLWAGENYQNAYLITLLFFSALLFPYTQNLGVVILQSRNQMKFYSILRILIALFTLVFSCIWVDNYKEVGCSLAVFVGLIGQTIVMNVYYQVKQNIDILQFWKEIFKVSVVPILFSVCCYYFIHKIEFDNLLYLASGIFAFSGMYFVICWLCVLNNYEKNILLGALKKITNHG